MQRPDQSVSGAQEEQRVLTRVAPLSASATALVRAGATSGPTRQGRTTLDRFGALAGASSASRQVHQREFAVAAAA